MFYQFSILFLLFGMNQLELWTKSRYEVFRKVITVMFQSFRTNMSGQTVQTQIRLLLEEKSDQGLHCLLLRLHLFDKIP